MQHAISRSTNVGAALAARAAVEAINGDPAMHFPMINRGRARTRDNANPAFQNEMGYLAGRSDQRGRNFVDFTARYQVPVRDGTGALTGAMNAVTYDSTGAFLVGELERLDYTMHMPLVSVEYTRDIDLREDVTVADEVSSFTYASFASAGGLGMGNGIRNGKAWISKEATQVTGVAVDIAKTPQPLRPYGIELKYDILELESAARVGRPIDAYKLEALNTKREMDVDEQVYVGDANFGDVGLFNHTLVTNVSNLPNGAAASPLWSSKTPAEILKDVNDIIQSTWQASGWKVMPNRLMLPPAQFGYISTQLISTGAGNISILRFLLENNVLVATGRGRLEILPAKWLIGAGSGGTIGTTGTVDRMVAYTKNYNYVRYPMTTMQRTPIQYDGMWHKMIYFCRLGILEVVYPETLAYRDGL